MIRVRYTHPVSRRIVSVRCVDEREAAGVRERVRAMRVKLRSGGATPSEASQQLSRPSDWVTLAEAAAGWMRHTSEETQRHARSLLLPGKPLGELGPLPLEALDGARLDRWIADLQRSYRDSSILAAWRVVSAIVREAVQRRKLTHVPWGDWRPRRLDPTPRPRAMTAEPADVARMLAAARELDDESMGRCPSLEARIACGLLLGCRQGEIAGLRWSDLDAASRRVTIARQYSGRAVKAGAATLRAPPELFEILERYGARLFRWGLYKPTGPVFPQLVRSGVVRRVLHASAAILQPDEVRRVVRRAGLPNAERWTVHSLRASFVCLELSSSGSLAHAMGRGRHRTIKAVQHYARGLLELEPPEPAWSLPPAPPSPPKLPAPQ